MHLTFSTFQYISLLFPALGSESQYFCLLGVGKSAENQFLSFLTAFLQRTFEFQTPRQMGKESKIDEFQEAGGRIFFQNCNFVISARAAKHQVKLGDTRS